MLLFRGKAPEVNASGVLLSMVSPVWRGRLYGKVEEDSDQLQLQLGGDEASTFNKLLALSSGTPVVMDGGVEDLFELGQKALLYQVEPVQSAVEDTVLGYLTVENCGSILTRSIGSGLQRVENGSRNLALKQFDAFAKTAGFLALDEYVLGSLLEDDGLTTEKEERVYESLVRWMKGGEAGKALRGEGLLRKIRFPFMNLIYLADVAKELLPDNTVLDGFLFDSVMLSGMPRNLWPERKLRFLDAKVLVPRKWTGGA